MQRAVTPSLSFRDAVLRRCRAWTRWLAQRREFVVNIQAIGDPEKNLVRQAEERHCRVFELYCFVRKLRDVVSLSLLISQVG